METLARGKEYVSSYISLIKYIRIDSHDQGVSHDVLLKHFIHVY